MVGDIAYHDYLVLMCYMDAEWTRRRALLEDVCGNKNFLAGHGRFTTDCCKYRDKVNKNYRKFCGAHGAEPTDPIASYLFNPMCFLPFGHADDLAIVLLDDFDPVHHLTTQIETTVEEVCVGFCPKVESFFNDSSDSNLCDLHTMLGAEPQLPKEVTGDGSTYWPATHEFQKTTPLLVFTKFKIHGLGTLGQGMLFQQGLFKAMANKIKRLQSLLYKKIDNEKNIAGLMSKEDIDSVKFCFVDVQGPEEIGTLIFCQNYSVAMTFVLGLRTLTFGDVFDVQGNIVDLLEQCKAHGSIIRLNRNLREEPVSNDINLLRALHVFRWTHSSLSIAPDAFFGNGHSNCNGYVEALLGIQISPGHRCKAEQEIENTLEKYSEKPAGKSTNNLEYHRAQIGVDDLLLPHPSVQGERQFPLVRLDSVISTVAENLHKFGFKRTKKDHGRDVIDALTTLIIPVPIVVENVSGTQVDFIFGEMEKTHFPPLAELLPLIQRRLCYAGELSSDEKKNLPHPGRLDLIRLKEIPARYGIPISLRRTIENLYQNFSIVMADPFLFDTVLDLYDTFATLHDMLTNYLPAERGRELGRNEGDLGTLDEGRVEQLSSLAGAIQNALMHRILKIHPEASIRDMAVDFRGGLNQILLAADAPVKCGLGLLRKYAMRVDKAGYSRVGGITRVGFMPGARCHCLTFGTESEAQLAYFEVDVPHILHVDSYCENLHESFHLSFNALRRKNKDDSALFSIRDPVMEGRVSEVFANLLCQMFIFGSDVESFMYRNLLSYSKSLTSVGRDDCETVVRFTELFIRLFLVIDAVPTSKGPESWGDIWTPNVGGMTAALKRFKEAIHKYGPFFSEYERLWNGSKREDVKSYCWKQFREIYPRMERFMALLWSEAIGIYRRFAEKELCHEDGSYNYDKRESTKSIEEALSQGRPLIRSLYQDPHHSTNYDSKGNHSKDKGDIGLNALVLVCQILYQYIQVVRKASEKSIHLYRRPKDREVEYSKVRPWYEFQLDKSGAALFCPVPRSRRERLRKQIVVLKSFWDISSNLRERRLWEILSDNWPESELLG